jgi:hypothetical protein
MALLTPTPPDTVSAAFSSGLPAFLSGGPAGTVVSEKYVGKAPPIPSLVDVSTPGGITNVTSALEAFVLTLQDAANNTGVISPAATGWIFFAGDANNKTVLGRLVQRRHAWKLVAVHYGPVIWETMLVSVNLAKTQPAVVPAGNYDLRLLAVPGLNLEVFWLAAQTPGSSDWIIPTPTDPSVPSPPLAPSPQPMQTFLAQIGPQAVSALSMASGYGA